MDSTNRSSIGILAAVFFASMVLAWNERIPDPWGLLLALATFLSLAAGIAAAAVKRSKTQR